MTVIPLRAEPSPPADPYVTLQPAARHAMTALEGRVAELRRIFAGSFATADAAARIGSLIDQIQTEAARVRRFAR